MGYQTFIQWCHATFNAWRGCIKISCGCANCYAAAGAPRNPKVLGKWGGEGNGTRIVAAETGWEAVRKWDCKAAKAKERHRVFCGSWMDIGEIWDGPMLNSHEQEMRINESVGLWSSQPKYLTTGGVHRPLTMEDVRYRLFDVIWETQNLDWLLLTKRPENLENILPWTSEHAGQYRERYWENVWIGTTVEDRAAKTRIDILRGIPAAIRFLSVEPLLEDLGELDLTSIHWVICGGESGPKARPCDLAWIRSVMRQCKDAGVPCFVKQLGGKPWDESQWSARMEFGDGNREYIKYCRIKLSDSHGGDPTEWPEDLRVRELPTVAVRV